MYTKLHIQLSRLFQVCTCYMYICFCFLTIRNSRSSLPCCPAHFAVCFNQMLYRCYLNCWANEWMNEWMNENRRIESLAAWCQRRMLRKHSKTLTQKAPFYTVLTFRFHEHLLRKPSHCVSWSAFKSHEWPAALLWQHHLDISYFC